MNFNLVQELTDLLMKEKKFDCTKFLSLPNATPQAIKKLHDAHKKARKDKK